MNEEQERHQSMDEPPKPPSIYEFTQLRRNDDGTFVVYLNNSIPCHITPDFPNESNVELYTKCAWIKLRKLWREHPEQFEKVLHPKEEPEYKQTNSEKMMDAYNEINRLNAEVIVGIDVDDNQQKIADLAMYIEDLRDNMR